MALSGMRRAAALLLFSFCTLAESKIDRESVVRKFNPHRNASSTTTPMQVGNGNFAYGADVTGMQTFAPFNILSSWCWHNASLPTAPGQTSVDDFTGLDWWTHGRLVNYDQPNPAEPLISNWLIQNPQRVNLGRIGLHFQNQTVTEADLTQKSQMLDLYTGVIYSSFLLNGVKVSVETVADPSDSTVSFSIQSSLFESGALAVFFDYPYMISSNKFEDPFVGIWNLTSNHTTTLRSSSAGAIIRHDLDATTYYTNVDWEGKASISSFDNTSHRYILQPGKGSSFTFSAAFSPTASQRPSPFADIRDASSDYWESYWAAGAFVDLTQNADPDAIELQRRIVLSQYLMAVNEAGHDPPQESGLTNNGWYGKFHMEMVMWHLSHWALWNRWDILDRSLGVYNRFLASSLDRAEFQGYDGARWGKMSDPTGRSAPGEINSLLIWQQPHPMWFAELEYTRHPSGATLKKWDALLVASADFMASYAWWNASTKVYDLGPPMYPMSENTNPNATVNPAFELAYWRFGLDVAAAWQKRQGKEVPESWAHVAENLAPLPVQNGTYVTYEGIQNMWTDSDYISDHPGLVAFYGLLPAPDVPSFSIQTLNATLEKVYSTWLLSDSYGWDFPLLAMTSARLGDGQKAVDMLLDEMFQFDDVGMPVGGSRVPTPYFPGAGGLLMAVAMMANGWSGSAVGNTLQSRWPEGWVVKAEGFAKAL